MEEQIKTEQKKTIRQFLAEKNECPNQKLVWSIFEPLLIRLEQMHLEEQYHGAISAKTIFVQNTAFQSCFRLSQDQAKKMSIGNIRLILDESMSCDAYQDGTITLDQGYTPLEAYFGKSSKTGASDVYGICAVIYTMITGEAPIDPFLRFAGTKIKKPSEMGVEIAKEYEEVLMKGLEAQSENRYQNVKELNEALEDIGAKEIEETDESAEDLYIKGMKHYRGDGARRVYKRAFEHFQRAAKQGHSDAQCCLGVCYYLGDGVKKSDKLAKEWLIRSAEQGNKYAQNNLLLWYKEEAEKLGLSGTHQVFPEHLADVKALVQQYGKKYPSVFRFNPKMTVHLQLKNHEVYLAHDDTVFGSGKNGFAITDKGIVVREMGSSAKMLTYQEFMERKTLRRESFKIMADQNAVSYLSGNLPAHSELQDLYRKIHSVFLMPEFQKNT